MKPTAKGTDSIINLINRNESGWFSLHDEHETETYMSFPAANGNEAVKAKPEDLKTALLETLGDLGEGKYKIQLKANSKANNSSHITLRFSTMNETTKSQGREMVSGLGYDKVEEMLTAREEKARREERELSDRQRTLDKLEQDIKLVQFKQELSTKSDKAPAWMQPLMALGTTVAIAVVAKVAPEAMPAIQQALAAFGEEEEEEEPVRVHRED